MSSSITLLIFQNEVFLNMGHSDSVRLVTQEDPGSTCLSPHALGVGVIVVSFVPSFFFYSGARDLN